MANKMVIASSRLPVTVRKVDGVIEYVASDGGLATGVASVEKSDDSMWVGWPGIASDELSTKERSQVTRELHKRGCHPVFLTQKQIDAFYYGYCNATLWPLFHYFVNKAQFSNSYWDAYQEANKLFAIEVCKYASKEARLWVHDYQLMLLPQMLRRKVPEAVIGFFLHTPFPSFELFRLLPERTEVLEGLLGADLIGFHTYDYARHFLSSVLRILGYENALGVVEYNERRVQIDAFPIGVDYAKWAKGARARSARKVLNTIPILGSESKVMLSVDRTDYSKGIPARLDAYELFLSEHPEYIGKVQFIMIVAPSREEVDAYKELLERIEQRIGSINGRFATTDWSPIQYRHQSIDFDELVTLYSLADVMVVTPYRDGMNLVAKEYVAAHHGGGGSLVLSEMAGVATELPEALLVNPSSARQVSEAFYRALTMPGSEQKERMGAMQERISEYTIHTWANDFLRELTESAQQQSNQQKLLSNKDRKQLLREYTAAERRLILLDYDGTLRGFVNSPDPQLARPSLKVLRILRKLNADKKNKVVIVSGRPRTTMELFFKDIGLELIAEHGGWIYEAGQWIKSSTTSKKWKKTILPVLQQYASRTPGARVEEKDFSLVWHYRLTSPDLAFVRNHELKQELSTLLDEELDVFEGKKILEIKPKSMHKGALVTEMMASGMWDFIFVAGDDYTDEDMFDAVPERAYTVNVGHSETRARFQLDGVPEVVGLIGEMSRSGEKRRRRIKNN